MPLDIYDKEFQNWLKGELALNSTREALCASVTETLDNFISKLPEDQKAHLEQFIICLNENGIKQLKQVGHAKATQKKHDITFSCTHELCKKLLEHFINVHEESAKLPYKWEHVQRGTTTSDPTRDYKDKKEVVWRVALLYMFVEHGEKVENYRCLDDLDISKVLKMMRSCRLFIPDGSLEFYDAVIEFRNDLMHSPNYKVTEQYLQEKLQKTRQLLECLSMTQHYNDTIQDLQKLGENDFIIKYHSEEYKRVVSEVLTAEKIAVDLHNSVDVHSEECRAQIKLLKEILQNISKHGPHSQLEKNPGEFRLLVKSFIEKKAKSIELDKTICGHSSDQGLDSDIYQELEELQEQAQQDLKDINEQLKKTGDEEMMELIDNLNKEVTALREASKKKENKIKQYVKKMESYTEGLATFGTEDPEKMRESESADERQPVQGKDPEDKEQVATEYQLNDNLLFYQNKMYSKPLPGYKIEEVLKWKGDYMRLGKRHDYMQWLFPIPESCGMNHSAQPLQKHEAKRISENETLLARVLEAYKMMLDFFGMELVNDHTGEIKQGDNWKERYKHLDGSILNRLQITRILKALAEFGFEYLQGPWLEFIIHEATINQELPGLNGSSMEHWEHWFGAIKDEATQGRLNRLLSDLNGQLQTWQQSEYESELGDNKYSGKQEVDVSGNDTVKGIVNLGVGVNNVDWENKNSKPKTAAEIKNMMDDSSRSTHDTNIGLSIRQIDKESSINNGDNAVKSNRVKTMEERQTKEVEVAVQNRQNQNENAKTVTYEDKGHSDTELETYDTDEQIKHGNVMKISEGNSVHYKTQNRSDETIEYEGALKAEGNGQHESDNLKKTDNSDKKDELVGGKSDQGADNNKYKESDEIMDNQTLIGDQNLAPAEDSVRTNDKCEDNTETETVTATKTGNENEKGFLGMIWGKINPRNRFNFSN